MTLIVPAEQLANVWPQVAPWIEKALAYAHGDENLRDVKIALARGQYQLWYVPGKYAAVVQVVWFPRQTVATVLYCGGSGIDDMRQTFEDGKAWCRANGVDVIRTYGREGWGRIMGLENVGAVLQVTV